MYRQVHLGDVDLLPDVPPYTCLKDAIRDSNDGDVILVHEGVYVGKENSNLDFKGRVVSIMGLQGRDHCIIDLEGKEDRRAFKFDGLEPLLKTPQGCVERGPPNNVVQGLTIRNGCHSHGGAVLCVGDRKVVRGSPRFVSCAFEKNYAKKSGGAVRCAENAVPEFESCVFLDNRTEGNGGALAVDGRPIDRLKNGTSTPFLTDGAGGCAPKLCVGVQATLVDCKIERNVAGARGGGIYVTDQARLIVQGGAITSNSAGQDGGGVAVEASVDSQYVRLRECSIGQNEAVSDGGGIWARSEKNNHVAWGGCDIHDNVAGRDGGGIWLEFNEESATEPWDGGKPDDVLGSGPTTYIRNNQASHNGRGGGVFAGFRGKPSSSGFALSFSIIAGNEAGEGGGVYKLLGSLYVLNCVVIGNRATTGSGGGARCDLVQRFSAWFCTITENKTLAVSGGIVVTGIPGASSANQATLSAYSTILFFNQGQQIFLGEKRGTQFVPYDKGSTFSQCDIEGRGNSAGMYIDVDPKLLPSSRNGYRYVLSPDSPCIDAGMTAYKFLAPCPQRPADKDAARLGCTGNSPSGPFLPWPYDIDGNCRLVAKFGQADLTKGADIGAYELP